jgi:MFS family permease
MRPLLYLTGTIVLVDTLFFAALTPLLPHYAHSLGLGKAGAGVLAGAYPAGALFGSIPSGIVAARLGVKPTVLVGMTVVAGMTAVFGLANAAWELDLARFCQGLASSFSWTGALAWLVAASPAGRRGRLIGQAFAAAVGGARLGPVPGSYTHLSLPTKRVV